jgi:hypothetical protein
VKKEKRGKASQGKRRRSKDVPSIEELPWGSAESDIF